MSKVFAEKRFVGVWKCTTRIKEVVFNNENLNFPDHQTKIISFSNTAGGTIMYMGQPSPDAKGFPASRASGIAVEFKFKVRSSKYILTEVNRINVVDSAKLIGESVQEWELPGKGIVAKIIASSEYRRLGRAPK
jgi:hypothetical protein